MTPPTLETPVGQMVVERPVRSKVFERYGIDYCCGGKLPLATICEKKGLDATEVLAAIAALDAESTPADRDWASLSISELIRHILDTHHEYLRESLPRLAYLSQKVARVHGEDRPELIELAKVFADFHGEMDAHMPKEEQVLFPLMLRLEESQGAGEGADFVPHPIAAMEAEHDAAGRLLERMNELTDGYQPPEMACNSYRALFAGLAEMEADTHQHIHLENNILHIKVLKLVGRA